MRSFPPILFCPRPQCLLSRFSPRIIQIQGMYMARLLDHIDVISIGRKNRVIFDHCSKRYLSVEGHSEPPFVWCFLIRHEILNDSWIAATFHGIRPPFVTPDCMQWHRKCSFFHSAHCSFSNPICFLICVVSTHNDSKKDLHRLCQSPRNCQCKRLLASSSAPGTLFLFCTGWTVTTQLPSLVPPRHIDDFSAIHFLHSELCDLQLRSGHDCVSAFSARSPCYFGLQAFFTIRILGKVRKYTMLTRNRFHVCSRLHWRFMRRSGSACTSLHRVSPKLF